jgi:hypothetical protein
MSFFLVAASLFSVFNIEKGEDARGTGAGYPYTGGGLKYAHSISNRGEVANLQYRHSRPHPFMCSIIPRDKRAEGLIVADSMVH